ncbi:retrovirus-related pol polyprotein from transposon TNT 1-94 [Tanacetum coccineum]
MFVTACNDNLNVKTSNVNFVYVTCGKCVLNGNHDMCVLHYINGVNSRTKKPIVVPTNIREPKRKENQSVATPHKKTVALEPTIKKPRSTFRKLYEYVSKTCSWWYPKLTPPGYKWKLKSTTRNVKPNDRLPLGIKSRTSNISEHNTLRGSTLFNTPLSSNSFVTRRGELVQGNITIERVYYVEGLNYNIFSVGQFCDADLEVAFRKSTCYVRDLKGNDFLTCSRGTDLYSITLQDTTSPNPICLMAKASSSQVRLWHRRLSHLNFDSINLLSKNDIVIGLLIYTWTHFLRSKDETQEVIIEFYRLVQRGLHAQVRIVRTDKDGENLDKMKEKGDACIFVGFDPASQCPTTALEHGSLSPASQSQVNVPQAAETTTTSLNELDMLFSPMFDEYFTGAMVYLSPLIIQTTPKHTIQAPTQTLTVIADENNNQAEVHVENAHVNEDKFINIFSTPVFEERESSSRHVDPSNMHTFYQRHPSGHH